MRLIIDTNIILDVLLARENLFDSSKAVLDLCESKKIQGFITASSATDIFYLARKGLANTDAAYDALGNILNIVKVLTVTNEDVNSAFIQHAPDFEDCLMATCARSNKCEGIVTRNTKDYKSFDITVYSPEELLNEFRASPQTS
jgi:predicted nucleic acid-binding protein